MTWRDPRALRHHDLRVFLGTGHQTLLVHEGARDRIVIPGVRARTPVRVVLVARDDEQRGSRGARARLRAGQRSS